MVIQENRPGRCVASRSPGRMGGMGTAGNGGFRRGAFRQGSRDTKTKHYLTGSFNRWVCLGEITFECGIWRYRRGGQSVEDKGH